MTTATADIRIIDMTQSDLFQLIEQAARQTCKAIIVEIESRMNRDQQKSSKTYYGIAGIAEALGVSKVTAQRWKTLGYLEGGYQQIGNNIIIDDAQKLRDTAQQRIEQAKRSRKGNRVSYSVIN